MKNEFELIGRISQKPELRNTKIDNINYTFVNIAVSKRIKQENGEYKDFTEFFKVTYFRKICEFISSYVNVGDLVLIKGHIKIKKDFDTERMTNLYSNELIGDTISILARSNKNKEKQKEEVKEETKEKIKTDEIEFDDMLPF